MAEHDAILDPASAAELSRRERLAFVDGAAAYQASMSEGGRGDRAALIDVAALEPGTRLLDVCTGPGWIAIEAVQACPGLAASGVDLSPAMVELGRANAAAAGVDVAFDVMDAARLELDDRAVDRITCGWGLMHVPDPVAALGEMARVTRPGGRLAASVWGPAAETVQGIVADALRDGAGGRAALDYGYVTRLGDEALLRDLLGRTGWHDVEVVPLRRTAVVPDPELVWMGLTHGTTFGTLVADLTEADREAVHRRVVELLEARRRPDGVHVPTSQLLVTATR